MEILQVLLSLLSNNENLKNLLPIINLFKNNSFDLKSVLQNLNLETIAPIIKEFMNGKKNSPTEKVDTGYGLNPITNIADKEIIYTLGKYFHQPLA